MVKELDLFESNNGCGMNGLSNGPCRRTRQHRWGWNRRGLQPIPQGRRRFF